MHDDVVKSHPSTVSPIEQAYKTSTHQQIDNKEIVFWDLGGKNSSVKTVSVSLIRF